MSTSRRPEAAGARTWLAKPAAAWLLIAISPLASGDDLIMRPGMRLKDKQVYSFDEDGVRLGPASRPIGWEEIEGGTVSRDQARFDRMRRSSPVPSTRSTPDWPKVPIPRCWNPPRRSFPGSQTDGRIPRTWCPRRSCGRTWRQPIGGRNRAVRRLREHAPVGQGTGIAPRAPPVAD